MLRQFCYLVLVLSVSNVINGGQPGYYTINAPKVLFPNSEYKVAVTIYKSPQAIPVKLTIGDKTYSDSKEVVVEPQTTEVVKFDIPDLQAGSYNLTVESNSIIEFKSVQNLQIVSQRQSVIIQTDKSFYKPGDLVRYRVIVFDRHLKPVGSDKTVTVSIKDGKSNLVHKQSKVHLTKGVYSNEMKLTSQPVFGNWRMTAEVDGDDQHMHKADQSFKVEEYELPTFEVKIDTPENVFYDDKKVYATVRATYTFGKPVKGTATVALYPTGYTSPLNEPEGQLGPVQPGVSYYSGPSYRYPGSVSPPQHYSRPNPRPYPQTYPSRSPYYIKRVVPIDGKGKIELDFEGLHFSPDPTTMYSGRNRRPGISNKYLTLHAVVEDELTNKKYNTTADILIHRVNQYLKLDKAPRFFQPNEPFKVSAKLVDIAGKPIQDTEHLVKFMLSRIISFDDPEDEPLCMTNETHVDKYGLATMTYILPASNQTISKYEYQITAKYLNTADKLHTLREVDVSSDKLSLEVKTDSLFVGKEVAIEIQAPQELEYFVYHVISKGNMIENHYIKVENKKHYTIKFTATPEMVPRAKVVVHYIHENILHEAETTIEFPKEPLNFIKLDMPTQSKPGQKVDITVRTNPNSYVALMGVDQSVNLYKESTSLTNEHIFNQVEKYYYNANQVLTISNAPEEPDHLPMPIPYWPGSRDPVGQPGIPGYAAPRYAPGYAARPAAMGMYSQSESLQYASPMTSSDPPADIMVLPTKIRTDFPETWIWDSHDGTDEQGQVTFSETVPDTITSWVVTGFSIDPVTGFAASKTPRTMQVIQPFFITTSLPYSVKRGETLAVPVSVYNYLEQDLETKITFHNSEQNFEFVGTENGDASEKTVTVPANSGESVVFVIRPTKAGSIHIKVTAASPLAGDAVEHILIVKPEGFTEHVTKSMMIDLRDASELTKEVTIDIPPLHVADSVYIEATVTADLLGNTLTNLHGLVQKPTGCGEQNMASFLPNVYIYKYLEKTNQLTDELKAKIFGYLEQGYQRQLSYKRDDGSFSAFGKSDSDGSVWLTAYVAQAIQEASNFIEIDGNVLNFAVRFLLSHQQENGGFTEAGVVIDKAHSSNEGIPLTAFVTLALIENVDKYPESDLVKASIDKALSYIVNKVTVADDIYSIAISAYVLQKTDHASKTQFMEMLEQRAKVKDDQKSWSSGDNSLNKYIEVNAYAALAYLEAEMISESLPVFKYLISNMNGFGGFQSTKDTVIGLKALSRFAETFPSVETDIKFVFRLPLDDDIELQVKADTALVLHSTELPSLLHTFKVIATGHGIALGQVTYKYNVDEFDEGDRFLLKPAVAETSTKTHLKLSACTSYVAKPGESAESNMAIMEVGLPSGYMFDKEKLNSLKGSYNIKRVETRDADTLAVLYFDFLNDNEVCPTFEAFRTHKVADEKPASVIVYDYYDNTRQKKEFYSTVASTICDICPGNCGGVCPISTS